MAKESREYEIVVTDDMNVDTIAKTLHENGIIEKVMPKVKPDTNAQEILDAL